MCTEIFEYFWNGKVQIKNNFIIYAIVYVLSMNWLAVMQNIKFFHTLYNVYFKPCEPIWFNQTNVAKNKVKHSNMRYVVQTIQKQQEKN